MNLSVWRYPNGLERTTAQTEALNEQNMLFARPDTEQYPGGAGLRGSIVVMVDPARGNLKRYHVQENIDAVLAAADTSGYPGYFIQLTVEKDGQQSITGTWVKSAGTADTNTANRLVDSGATFITDGVLTGDTAQNITDGGSATIVALLYSATADGNTENKLVDSSETFDADGTVAVGDIVFNTTDGNKGFVGAIDSDTTLSIVDGSGNDLDLFPDGNENYQIFRAPGLAVDSNTSLLLGDISGDSPSPTDLFPDGDEDYQIISQSGAAQQWVINTTNIEKVQAKISGTGSQVQLVDSHQGQGKILLVSEIVSAIVTAANAGTHDVLESFTIAKIDQHSLASNKTIAINKELIEKRIASYLGGSDTALFVRRSKWKGGRHRLYITG